MRDLHLIGYASGLAGVDSRCGEGPIVMRNTAYLKDCEWQIINSTAEYPASAMVVKEINEKLAHAVSPLIQQKKKVCVLGGDHTSAIGTWSGVYDALRDQGELGLIWIDAHMDSHTPETTVSGRIHGMPLAVLLGQGSSILTELLHQETKLKPENVCLIGVRSFEEGEAELLKKLNVKIYFMDEVKQRGLGTVLKEAVTQTSQNTVGFGISLDLDSIDPHEAPGVDVPELDGIHALDLIESLAEIASHDKLIMTEIVEFDPCRDKAKLTENLIIKLIRALYANESKNT